MTRVLEFPRANNRNGIQTLRIIRVRKLIRTTDSIVYRPPILIPTQISSSRSREKYSDISRMGNRPSIISPIGPLPLQKLSRMTEFHPWNRRPPPVIGTLTRGRGDLSASIGNFSIVSIPRSASFSRVPSRKLPRIISNSSEEKSDAWFEWRVEKSQRKNTNLLNCSVTDLFVLRMRFVSSDSRQIWGEEPEKKKRQFSLIN